MIIPKFYVIKADGRYMPVHWKDPKLADLRLEAIVGGHVYYETALEQARSYNWMVNPQKDVGQDILR